MIRRSTLSRVAPDRGRARFSPRKPLGAAHQGTAAPAAALAAWPLSYITIDPGADRWATYTGLLVLLLTLILAISFYHRLVRCVRRSERQLRELLETAPFAVGVTRHDTGAFLFANHRAIELLGLDPVCYRQQVVPYAGAEDDRQRMLTALARDGRIQDMEMEMVSYQGRRFTALGSVTPIEFAGTAALVGAFQDISQQKEAELRVRTSEARLRALFETVPDGIVVLGPNGRILQASESCATLIGDPDLTRHMGRSILDFVPEADGAVARDMLAKVVAEQPRTTISYRIARPDGSTIWIEPRGVPIVDPTTGQALILLVLRDITQRRQAEEQLAAHAAELQEALARITQLQNEFLRVCAWTKQVNIDGKWIPIDHYLAKHLGIKVSHGISEEGMTMLGAPPEQPEPPQAKEADRDPS